MNKLETQSETILSFRASKPSLHLEFPSRFKRRFFWAENSWVWVWMPEGGAAQFTRMKARGRVFPGELSHAKESCR